MHYRYLEAREWGYTLTVFGPEHDVVLGHCLIAVPVRQIIQPEKTTTKKLLCVHVGLCVSLCAVEKGWEGDS